MFKSGLFSALAAGAFLVLAVPASADLLDPATLHTGTGAGTICATGGANSGPCQYLYQNHTEVNGIGPSEFDLYQESNGVPLLNPVLLIFGVPNNPTNTIGNVTGAQLYNPYPGGSAQSLPIQAGSTAYGLNLATSFAGEMTSSSIYSFLGLGGSGVDKSNSFTNWAGADSRSTCSPWT
jgi:hypothetical protein